MWNCVLIFWAGIRCVTFKFFSHSFGGWPRNPDILNSVLIQDCLLETYTGDSTRRRGLEENVKGWVCNKVWNAKCLEAKHLPEFS